MILFAVYISIFTAALLFVQPSPDSLKGSKLSFSENFRAVRGSLILGLTLTLIFLVTSDFKFLKINHTLLAIFGLSNLKELSVLWPLQFFSHHGIHNDLVHLTANLSGLALTSAYERRVGTKRYLKVLMVSALSSSLSILFFPNSAVVCGISGGICGLAAAYFIDFEEAKGKHFVMTLVSFTILFALFSYTGAERSFSSGKVDHVGHIIGAIAGIVYCRYTRRAVSKTT